MLSLSPQVCSKGMITEANNSPPLVVPPWAKGEQTICSPFAVAIGCPLRGKAKPRCPLRGTSSSPGGKTSFAVPPLVRCCPKGESVALPSGQQRTKGATNTPFGGKAVARRARTPQRGVNYGDATLSLCPGWGNKGLYVAPLGQNQRGYNQRG